MQEEVRGSVSGEGGYETGISGVSAWRFTTGKIQMPQTENPYLYLVLDGMLIGAAPREDICCL